MKLHHTLSIAVVLLLVTTGLRAEIIDRVVAVVGGQIISKSDVDGATALGLASNLQELIDRTLMLNEVQRVAAPDPPAAALEARIARIRAKFQTPQALELALAASGLDEAALRVYAADDVRLATYLDERFSSAAQLSDDEVRQADEATRGRLLAERRQTLVNAWIAELRRRAEITVLP